MRDPIATIETCASCRQPVTVSYVRRSCGSLYDTAGPSRSQVGSANQKLHGSCGGCVVQFLPAAHDAQDDACGCGWTGERSLERGKFAEGILERVMNTIPKHWLRRCATPAEFEREQLERTAAAWSLPIEKVVQKFEQRPFRSGTTER